MKQETIEQLQKIEKEEKVFIFAMSKAEVEKKLSCTIDDETWQKLNKNAYNILAEEYSSVMSDCLFPL